MIEETLLRIAVALEKLVELRAAPLVLNAPVAAEVPPPTVNDALEKPSEDAPVAEPPRKKRGRPTKEEAAAKAAAAAEEPAAALPVEQPKCPDCGAVLTAENSSKLKTGAMFHVGCPKDAAPAPVDLKIEKVREAALAFTKARESAAPGTGRQAFIDVLAGMGAKTLADVPQPKWAELVQKLTA